MSESKKSFWSTVPGLVTGLAGLLTGVVGLITVLIQLGVIGGGHDSGGKTVAASNGAASTLPGTSDSTVGGYGGSGGVNTTAGAATFTVLPTSLDFAPTDPKDKTVTVKNTSAAAKLTVDTPTISGTDAQQFSASFDSCTSAPLPANASCTLKVTFKPSGALRKYTATLRVSAEGVPRVSEVAITASTLL